MVTRFPFGLFVKTGRLILDEEVLVFPAVVPLDAARRRALAGGGARPVRRRGRGHDLYNLRDYRPGDDRRLIHWRSSARTGTLTVRETEAETALDVRIVLVGDGRASEAAGGRAVQRPRRWPRTCSARAPRSSSSDRASSCLAGRGRAHRRRVLTALALYQPGAARPSRRPPRARSPEVAVDLG